MTTRASSSFYSVSWAGRESLDKFLPPGYVDLKQTRVNVLYDAGPDISYSDANARKRAQASRARLAARATKPEPDLKRKTGNVKQWCRFCAKSAWGPEPEGEKRFRCTRCLAKLGRPAA